MAKQRQGTSRQDAAAVTAVSDTAPNSQMGNMKDAPAESVVSESESEPTTRPDAISEVADESTEDCVAESHIVAFPIREPAPPHSTPNDTQPQAATEPDKTIDETSKIGAAAGIRHG